MTLSPGSPKCLKFCTDVEIPNYEGRGEERDGRGRRTDFTWQKGDSCLSSAPSPSPCPHPTATHAAMYAIFPGMLQTQPLAHVLHSLKWGSRLCTQRGKTIPFGGPKPTTKSPPASPGTQGQEKALGERLPALARTGHGVHFIRNHAAAVSTLPPATWELLSRLDTPSLIVQQQEAGE